MNIDLKNWISKQLTKLDITVRDLQQTLVLAENEAMCARLTAVREAVEDVARHVR